MIEISEQNNTESKTKYEENYLWSSNGGVKAQWPTTVHGAYIGGGTKIETDFFNL